MPLIDSDKVLKIIQRWEGDYPLDIFPKHERYFVKRKSFVCTQQSYDTLVTQVSANMGRHMAARLKEEIQGLLK